MITRAQYLNHEHTHREYYAQFVTPGILHRVKAVLGEKIRKSRDPHFNDISLNQWDELGLSFANIELRKKLKERGDFLTQAGMVCILKEAGKQIKEGAI